jgi:hypothetical protein
MIQLLKNLFTKDGWVSDWKGNLITLAYTVVVYVVGAFGGAAIQAIKDAVK